ncbi:hypothetical protein Rhein_1490 [Rheinheimera sp. A13L]|uniref:hypothetical protein n=1 Tax=Rheinheimera sp. A13L TaxID=506534 RepID=UPI00021251F0|nr:hypothetical protein [Rheinheimera sp. A13L]EGM78073.1 hypothetical protein Rhein_1490 [Rheinheimera sp. A13L]
MKLVYVFCGLLSFQLMAGSLTWQKKADLLLERVDVSRLNFVRSGAALNAKRGAKFSYSK